MNFRGASAIIRPVLQHVAAQGYVVELAAGSGHWKVSDPTTGAFLCALPHTPSSRQAAARANSVLRRAGISSAPSLRPRVKATSKVERASKVADQGGEAALSGRSDLQLGRESAAVEHERRR